jgi:hypothetical protein
MCPFFVPGGGLRIEEISRISTINIPCAQNKTWSPREIANDTYMEVYFTKQSIIRPYRVKWQENELKRQ